MIPKSYHMIPTRLPIDFRTGSSASWAIIFKNTMSFDQKNNIVDRWRDAVSPGSPPLASDDVDLLSCDISLDFPFRGAYRGLNVPGA